MITITCHSSFAFTAKYPFFVLAAPSQEVQRAWVNALWQAAVPRAELVGTLQRAGLLASVQASYTRNVQVSRGGGRSPCHLHMSCSLPDHFPSRSLALAHRGPPTRSPQDSFPVADAAVLSTGGRARIAGAASTAGTPFHTKPGAAGEVSISAAAAAAKPGPAAGGGALALTASAGPSGGGSGGGQKAAHAAEMQAIQEKLSKLEKTAAGEGDGAMWR